MGLCDTTEDLSETLFQITLKDCGYEVTFCKSGALHSVFPLETDLREGAFSLPHLTILLYCIHTRSGGLKGLMFLRPAYSGFQFPVPVTDVTNA